MPGRNRDLLWLLIMLLLAAAASTYVHMPLIFDGSLVVLKMREYTGFCIPHHRYGDQIVQFPALTVMKSTDDLAPAISVFSASYAAIPLIVLFLSWLVVRNRQPSLLVWPVIAVCLTALCAQLMQVGEAHIADQLAWPLFLGILTQPGRVQCGLLLALAVLIAAFHPLSVLWLLLTAAAALVIGYRFPSSRANLSWLATLLILIAVVRLLLLFAFVTEYESQNLSAATAAALARDAFSGWALLVSLSSITAGALLLPLSIIRKVWALRGCLALCALSGAASFWWSTHLGWWQMSRSYERYLFLWYGVLMVLALVDALRQAPVSEDTLWYMRIKVINVIATIFLCVTVAQCGLWLHLTQALRSALYASDVDVVELKSQKWLRYTPLAHWGTAFHAILLQGRTPQKLILSLDDIQYARKTGRIRLASWEEDFQNIWFKLPDVPSWKTELPAATVPARNN